MKIVNDTKMYEPAEIATMTGMSERTVLKYLREGTINGVKLSGKW